MTTEPTCCGAGPHESLTVDRSSSAEVDALSSDILPDWYEDWVIVEAESWRPQRLHALETLADDLRSANSGSSPRPGCGARSTKDM